MAQAKQDIEISETAKGKVKSTTNATGASDPSRSFGNALLQRPNVVQLKDDSQAIADKGKFQAQEIMAYASVATTIAETYEAVKYASESAETEVVKTKSNIDQENESRDAYIEAGVNDAPTEWLEQKLEDIEEKYNSKYMNHVEGLRSTYRLQALNQSELDRELRKNYIKTKYLLDYMTIKRERDVEKNAIEQSRLAGQAVDLADLESRVIKINKDLYTTENVATIGIEGIHAMATRQRFTAARVYIRNAAKSMPRPGECINEEGIACNAEEENSWGPGEAMDIIANQPFFHECSFKEKEQLLTDIARVGTSRNKAFKAKITADEIEWNERMTAIQDEQQVTHTKQYRGYVLTQPDIDEMLESKEIDAATYTDMTVRLDKFNAKSSTENKELALASILISNGTTDPYDDDHKSALNTHFRGQVALFGSMSPIARLDKIGKDLEGLHGFIPDPYAKYLNNAVFVEGLGQGAAMMIADILANPARARYAEENDSFSPRAENTAYQILKGHESPEVAFKLAKQEEKVHPDEVAGNLQYYNANAKDIMDASFTILDKRIGKEFSRQNPWFSGLPKRSNRMNREYSKEVKDLIGLGVPDEQAYERASNSLLKRFQPTNVNDVFEFMENPPNQYYRATDKELSKERVIAAKELFGDPTARVRFDSESTGRFPPLYIWTLHEPLFGPMEDPTTWFDAEDDNGHPRYFNSAAPLRKQTKLNQQLEMASKRAGREAFLRENPSERPGPLSTQGLR